MPNNDSTYFRELYAVPDTVILPEDEPVVSDKTEEAEQKKEIKLGKLQKRHGRLAEVYASIKSPGFKHLEISAMYRIRYIERVAIWEALKKGDKSKTAALWAEHEGILRLFLTYNKISEELVKINEDIKILSKPDTLTAADEVGKHIE